MALGIAILIGEVVVLCLLIVSTYYRRKADKQQRRINDLNNEINRYRAEELKLIREYIGMDETNIIGRLVGAEGDAEETPSAEGGPPSSRFFRG